MPNGKPGDNPLSDLSVHGAHPFRPDIEEMLWRLHAVNPALLERLRAEPFDWERGQSLEQGRELLRRLLGEAAPRAEADTKVSLSPDRPRYRIDGAAFLDLEGFYDEVETQLLGGAHWGRNLDALNDILRGEVGPLPREFTVVWEHSDISHQRLGGIGRGSFAELLEIFAEHPNVELVLS